MIRLSRPKAKPALPTEKKEIAKKLWTLSYPTMISFGLESFYDIVDMAWVGQISPESLSGVTIFSTIYMLFTVLNEVAGDASISLISQYYGRGDKETTQRVAEQTISFKIVLAFISMALLLIFIRPVMEFYTDDPKVISEALSYGYIRIFFIPVLFALYSVNTIFRCTQDSITPMKIMLISAILNLILDPILMFETVPFLGIPGAGLGVLGAAWATILASAAAFIYGFTILATGRRKVRISIPGLFRLDKTIDKKLLFIGIPSGVQFFIRQFFNAAMVKFVAVYGTTAIALAGINGKLNGFALMPIFGLTMAGSTLVGAALGENRIKEAELVTKVGALVNLIIVGSLSLLIAIFARPIMSLFSQDPMIVDNGIPMLWIMAVDIPLLAYCFGHKVVFSGSGYNRPKLIATLGSTWLVHLPVVLVMIYVLQVPILIFWTSYLFADTADLLITLYYYNQPTWRFNRV